MPQEQLYLVRIVYDDRTAGVVSGPFTRGTAEAFAVAAIGRLDVQKVTIEEVA